MKKILSVLLAVTMLLGMTACGQKKAEYPEWSRVGNFDNEDGDMLIITKSEDEGYPGWAVTFIVGEEIRGWFIPQEEDKLHGNLVPDYEEGEYIVTISAEGEDGVAVETPDGKVYHFTPMDMSVYENYITVTINTEGLGWLRFNSPNEELYSSGENFDSTSVVLNIPKGNTYKLEARSEDGWEFVKWTLNGEDYSTEDVIEIEFNENTDIIAVFEFPTEE